MTMAVFYAGFIALYVVSCLNSLTFSLDPPGGDTVTILRSDLQTINATLENVMGKYSSLQQEVTALKAQKSNTQVAFTVALTPNTNLGSSQDIKFDKIITNIGNGYNKYHGQFTTPVAGTYYFSYHVIAYTTSHLHVQLIKNGVEISRAFSSDNHDTGSGSAATHLEVGDVVWLRHMAGLGTQTIEGGHSWREQCSVTTVIDTSSLNAVTTFNVKIVSLRSALCYLLMI